MRNQSVIAAIVLPASAAAFGAGVGDLVGFPAVACAMDAMAIVLTSAAHVSALTAARAIAVMAAAAGLGYVTDGVPAREWNIDAAAFGNANVLGHTLVALAIRGAARLGVPAALFAAAMGGRSRSGIGVVAFVASLAALHYAGGLLIDALPDAARSLISSLVMADKPIASAKNGLVMWGGALAAMTGVFIWSKILWSDDLALRLGCWGAVAGAIALPVAHVAGSMLAGKADWFPAGIIREALGVLDAGIVKETLFGSLWGAILGWGAWRNRKAFASTPDVGSLRFPWEVGLLAIHMTLMLAATFAPSPAGAMILRPYRDSGILGLAIPLICSLAGRRSPWLVVLPVVMAPVIGCAIRHCVYETQDLSADMGWSFVVAIPLAIVFACASWASLLDEEDVLTRASLPIAVVLLVETAILFGLAVVLLDFAWPWLKVSPNSVALGLLMGCVTILGFVATPIAMVSSTPDNPSTPST